MMRENTTGYRPDLLHFLPKGKKIMVSNPFSRVRADVHRTSAFDSSNLPGPVFSKQKGHPSGCPFSLCLRNTLDAASKASGYRPDLLHFLPEGKKIMVLNPSSRVQADVHRTSAIDFSNLVGSISPSKKGHPLGCPFCLEVPARFELANESFAGILTTAENPRDTNHFLIRLLQNDNHLLIILRSVIVGLTAVFPYPFFKFLL